MRALPTVLFLIVLLMLHAAAYARDLQSLPGQVTRIVDGDTIVLESGGARHRVRLAGIDAPERNQPWGDASTRELRRQVAGQHVVVEWYKRDRWKRLIGVIRLDDDDMNLHLVERGLAWHSKRYQDEQSPGNRDAHSAAEKAAQGARRGLWSDPEPIPPWEGRKR